MATTRVKSYVRKDGTRVRASTRKSLKERWKTFKKEQSRKADERYVKEKAAQRIIVNLEDAKTVREAENKTRRRAAVLANTGLLTAGLVLGRNYYNNNPIEDQRKLVDLIISRQNNLDLNILAEKFNQKVKTAEALTTPNFDRKALPGTKIGKVPDFKKSLAKEALKTKIKARLLVGKNKASGFLLKRAVEANKGMSLMPGSPLLKNVLIGTTITGAGTVAAVRANKKARKERLAKEKSRKNKKG